LTPISGSSVTALETIDNSSKVTWDKDLYARTSGDKKKRGSVLTRGTLVVCNVSLVGQWISEAKSILKDSGMVYSYHGSSRKRDPLKLAQAAIVVTTYETLVGALDCLSCFDLFSLKFILLIELPRLLL